MSLLSSANFVQNQIFQTFLSGAQSECQKVWIKIMTDVLSVLIWVQTVGKGYQQTTENAATKERGEPLALCLLKMSKYTEPHF